MRTREGGTVVLTFAERATAAKYRMTDAEYARALVGLHPWRSGVAKCDRCDADVGRPGDMVEVDRAPDRVTSEAVLVAMEVDHALSGCNGSLSWEDK